MPPKNRKTGKGPKKKKEASGAAETSQAVQHEDDDFYKEPIKRVVKPDDLLTRDDVQMEELHTRVLTANDPNVANNIFNVTTAKDSSANVNIASGFPLVFFIHIILLQCKVINYICFVHSFKS